MGRLRENPASREFILADARDADMAWGVPGPGKVYPPPAGGGRFRTMPEFHEQIRTIARQGIVDIMLASIATMSRLAHRERLFEGLEVTPAVRINDTSDVWCPRGGRYREPPSLPFASGFIEEAQFGSLTAGHCGEPVVNLGLYSVTFNNQPLADRESLLAFKEFRTGAQREKFDYFLEVFAPNVEAGLRSEEIPAFVNDNVCRMLAGVPLAARPVFLKIPYFGPHALEELVAYDPSVIVGVLGGSSGATAQVLNPSDGSPLATVARGGVAEIDEAVAAAGQAFPAWSALSPNERAAKLHRFAEQLDQRAQRVRVWPAVRRRQPERVRRRREQPGNVPRLFAPANHRPPARVR